MLTSEKYDAIIVGGGVSGLVCGCYLAKSGLKVLLIEKNPNVGGYCTSFTRKGFSFDACVYSLSSFRKDGILNKIYNDLSLSDNLKLLNYNISDTVITPFKKISFYKDYELTANELCKAFSKLENKIRAFFHLIQSSSVLSLTKFRKCTFKDLLDSYFSDGELKTILSIASLGYTGLPPSSLSAFIAILIFREFIFDGGYYPEGGMQKFPDSLAVKLKNFGGKIYNSMKVDKIIVENNQAKGVQLKNGEIFYSKFVISACDIHQTFFELIDSSDISKYYIEKINNGSISLSAYLTYLGVSKDLSAKEELKSHTWLITNNSDNIESIYSNTIKNDFDYIALSSPSLKNNRDFIIEKKDTLFIFVNSIFQNKQLKNINEISENLINKAGKFIPGLESSIKLKLTASPSTLYKWTLNFKGAAYGWSDTVSQFGDPDFSEKTKIKNLYLTGHWTNKSSGVASVINSGYITAGMIAKNLKNS